jgi:Fe-S oxidoreductase
MNPGKIVNPRGITEDLRRPGYQPAPVATFFRFDVEGGITGAAVRCVGVGKCRKTGEGTMCPSYMVTREEQHSTRGRAHLLFEMLRGETITGGWASDEVKSALDLCLACKACKSECPVSVDMASYKAEFLAHYYERRRYPLRAHLFGHIDWWAAFASRAPTFVNALSSTPFAKPLQAAAGIAPQRRVPRFAHETFQRWWQRHRGASLELQDPPNIRSVLLWSDTFTNYFHPEVGRAAVGVLEALRYNVTVLPQTCCGRPLYDFGLLPSARDHLEVVFERLAASIDEHTPIVVLEPSCFAVFRDEAVNLFPDREIAKALAERVVLFDAFVRPHFERGALPLLGGAALVHLHCHQTALGGHDESARALAAAGLAAPIDAGCCGMAGSFGFDKAHYQVSLDIGERVLLPAVRAAPANAHIIADGFSCREQIRHATGRRARHFAEMVWMTMERPGV